MSKSDWRVERWRWRRVQVMEQCALVEPWEASVAKTVTDPGSVRPDGGVDGEYSERVTPLNIYVDDVIGVDELEDYMNGKR